MRCRSAEVARGRKHLWANFSFSEEPTMKDRALRGLQAKLVRNGGSGLLEAAYQR